ncbi:hypothetical protein [Shewanella xiamenensis]|uniref:hypothetical protein n=1 Tax=Shewanella xiamenensis TaxID=332186 RepID=UPI0035B747CE
MTNTIAAYIASFSAESISNAFIYLIVLIFITSLFLAYLGRYKSFTHGTANSLTSLGILGTFAGIVVGLMEFNPSNIDGSIELLLEGLKTAFLTSLVGMAASILYKTIVSFYPKGNKQEHKVVSPEDIYQVMSQQLIVSNELLGAIKGDEDSSLTSQIKNLRLDMNDASKHQVKFFEMQLQKFESFQSILWEKMDEFAEMLSKSATEQVINALKGLCFQIRISAQIPS